jgi:hypothetical protein
MAALPVSKELLEGHLEQRSTLERFRDMSPWPKPHETAQLSARPKPPSAQEVEPNADDSEQAIHPALRPLKVRDTPPPEEDDELHTIKAKTMFKMVTQWHAFFFSRST